MNLFFALTLTGLMHALRSFSPGEAQGSTGASLAFGYLLLTAYFVGGAFKQLRLPRLTGYIATGIVTGPSVLGMLTDDMVSSLTLVNGMAVALIAMTAGTEFELRIMRPLFSTIRAVTAVAVVGTAVLLTAAVLAMRGALPFMAGMGPLQKLAVAAVLGVVMAAQSPAVVVALRDEMEADGPITRTVLGIVVVADLLVILLFALASAMAKAALGQEADTLATLGLLAWELAGSIGVGVLIGYVLALYLRRVRGGAELFLLTVAFIIAEVGQRLHLDPLLVALAAGILIRNATTVGDALHRHIAVSSLPVYILFFAVAGATLHLDVLRVVGGAALVFVAVRAAGLLGGAWLGARLANAPKSVQRYAGFGLLPQAGLALALSMLFGKTFPEFGAEAAALTLGVVALNELIAPAVYRFALVKSGEAGQAAPAGQHGAAPEASAVAPTH